MPRCCVPGCDTGSSAEIMRTRKAKARNKSTFLLPADYKLFKKWTKVLKFRFDTEEGRSGRVCELHFHEADIIRHYYKQMENGTIQQFTFARPTLIKGIIPLKTPRKEDLSPYNNVNKRSYKKKKNPSKDKKKKDLVSKQMRGTKRSRDSSDDSDDEDFVPNKRSKSSKRTNKNYEKRNYSKRQIRTPRNKLIPNCEKTSPLIYNFDRLLHNLKRKNCRVPKDWEFHIVNDNTAKFVYTTESSKNFLTCILRRETSLEIIPFNKNVVVKLEFNFLSQPHLLENLVDLQKVRCCKGIKNRRFAKRCKGFVPFKGKEKKLGNFGRCRVCKKVWCNMIKMKSHCHVKLSKPLHSKIFRVKLNGKLIKCSKRKIKTLKKYQK